MNTQSSRLEIKGDVIAAQLNLLLSPDNKQRQRQEAKAHHHHHNKPTKHSRLSPTTPPTCSTPRK
jgi:hypothetical protein